MSRAPSSIWWLATLLLTLLGTAGCRSSAVGDLPTGHSLEDGQQLSVRFEGNRQYSAKKLLEIVRDDFESVGRRSSIRATVDDAAYTLEVYYHGQGFPACLVDYRLEESAEGPMLAILQVDEGPRVRVSGVIFEGNETMPADELESFVLLPGRMFLPDPVQWYVASQVEDSRSALEAFYMSRGYLSAEVDLSAPDSQSEDWSPEVTLQFVIREGPLYVLRSLAIEGGERELNERVSANANLGKAVSPRVAGVLRGMLREVYAENGYPDADVSVAERSLDNAGFMDLRLAVVPGTLVTLGNIRIEGQKRTREQRIRDNLAMHPGDEYDVRTQRHTFENLYRLGVFSTVAVELEGEGPQRDVLVRLSEAPGREFFVEPGYGSYEQLRLTVGWRELNLAGTARSLDVEGTISQKSLGGTIGLNDARFLDSATAANLTFFGGVREEPSYTTGGVGGLFAVSRDLREHLSATLAYQYRFSEVTSDDFTDPAAEAALENVNISSILFSPNWDRRDNVFFPSSGEQLRLTFSLADEAIGSQINFLRTTWTLGHFWSNRGGIVLGLSWRGGLIAPFGSTDVIPIQERFFNGGENTVRSYTEDQLGPKDSSGNPVGGEGYNVLTAELRAPVVGRFQTALFYDTGNVVSSAGDVLDFSDMGSAIGLGLRYALPVGPVRLDVGVNPDPEPGDADYVVHLSVGYSF